MLPFELDILAETNATASVTVVAKGIPTTSVIEKLIEWYANEYSMCFILNCTPREKKYFSGKKKDRLCDISELSINKRIRTYRNGGVFFGSSRAFITDFVNENMDISKISTIIVLNADRIQEDSTESFILYILKRFNTLGLIRAIISNPLGLSNRSILSISRNFLTSKFLFYPRFHNSIKESLNDIDGQITYIKQKKGMKEIIVLILDIIQGICKTLGKQSTMDYMKVFLFRQKSSDLRDFKILVSLLFNCDIMSFYIVYKAMLAKQQELRDAGTWIFSESSHILMDTTKKYLQSELLMYKHVEKESVTAVDICESLEDEIENEPDIDFDELYLDCENSDQEEESEISSNENFDKDDTPPIFENSRLFDHLSSPQLKELYLRNQKISKVIESVDPEVETLVLVQNRTIRKIMRIILKCFDLQATVETHHQYGMSQKKYSRIILLNPNLGSIRAIEYNSSSFGFSPEIKILVYENSLEEQIYLSEIREEKDIFERLIEERYTLPLKMDLERLDIEENSDEENRNWEIVVDSREMRAKLPFYLYRAENILKVSTIMVGDYIIGSNTCIERKSIEDFRQSIASGRLYQQGKRMVYEYEDPILLLEFDGGVPTLSIHDKQTSFKNSLVARLCVFLMAFSKIKLIWSNNPLFTTKVIRDIQTSAVVKSQNTHVTCEDPILHEILLSIPGVNSFIVGKIFREFKNLKDLAFSEISRLEKLMETSRAREIYDFFREKFT